MLFTIAFNKFCTTLEEIERIVLKEWTLIGSTKEQKAVIYKAEEEDA
jgi:hypothetical protein